MTDKDFVLHDNYNRDNDNKEDKFDDHENYTYETAIEEYRKKLSRFFKIAVGVFLIFAVLFTVIIFKSQNLVDKKQVLAIEKRLDGLEAEFTSLKTYIASKLDQAIKEMEQDRHTTAIENAPSAKTPPSAQKEQKDVEPKVHKVLAGESLFRISRYYGLTIEQIRDYNNLEPNATIYPGQKLKLSP